MPDEINFVDLAALTRVTPDAVVEKFGSAINSSFFDASSILATLKQKGMIDFTTAFPGQSAITITDLGKQLLNEAHDKANTPFDQLDLTILSQLSAGKRNVQELNQSVNVTQKDFALRIYKLAQNAFLSYDMRNGSISIALTEKGFLQVKSGMPQPMQAAGPTTIPQAPQEMQQAAQTAQQGTAQQQSQQKTDASAASKNAKWPQINNLSDLEKKIHNGIILKQRYTISVAVAIILVVIVYSLILLKIKI